MARRTYIKTSSGWEEIATEVAVTDSPDFNGEVTAPTLRLTSTDDASASSTTHALQVGDTASTNIRIDGNEILAVNNGAVGSLNLQADGGTLNIGGTTGATVNLNDSRVTADHYPYAVAAGTVSLTGNGTGTVTATVTFPSGRFSATPVITVSPATTASTLFASFQSQTSTGMTVRLSITTSTFTTSHAIHWHAIQMTSSSGAG